MVPLNRKSSAQPRRSPRFQCVGVRGDEFEPFVGRIVDSGTLEDKLFARDWLRPDRVAARPWV